MKNSKKIMETWEYVIVPCFFIGMIIIGMIIESFSK